MTWKYEQISGDLYHNNSYEGRGYSGIGPIATSFCMEGLFNPGPFPEGAWIIGPPHEPVDHLGVMAMPLTPSLGTNAFGRSAFFMHGDNSLDNESASHGCIIMGRAIRQAVLESGDHNLVVTNLESILANLIF